MGCGATGSMSWDAPTMTLTFNGLFPTVSSYLTGGKALQFSLQPFTNPISADKYYFIWSSYTVL
jgi:hypothetical protein